MKMKKAWMITASCVMATAVMAGSAYAKTDNPNAGAKDKDVKVSVEGAASATVTSSTYTVTSSTYGETSGHNGYKGLLNAIENTQDKPAGAVIAETLLTRYGTQLTAEQKSQLEAIKDKAAALSAAADVLAQQGSVTDAVYAQKEAIKADIKNLDSYKKLGKLKEKLGETGVQLYVNGEEPNLEVKPFIREGNTLVPFRAISEALKAEVSWNEQERSVTVTRDGITVKLYIDSKTAYVDGKEVTLEVPAAIENGSTVVPVRFVSEALKATVKWEGDTKSVVIYEEN